YVRTIDSEEVRNREDRQATRLQRNAKSPGADTAPPLRVLLLAGHLPPGDREDLHEGLAVRRTCRAVPKARGLPRPAHRRRAAARVPGRAGQAECLLERLPPPRCRGRGGRGQ